MLLERMNQKDLNKITKYNDKGYYIHFNEVTKGLSKPNFKFGINPYNQHDTPLGIYAYPIWSTMNWNSGTIYAKEREYAFILKPKEGKNIIHISEFTSYRKIILYYRKILELTDGKNKIINELKKYFSSQESYEIFEDIFNFIIPEKFLSDERIYKIISTSGKKEKEIIEFEKTYIGKIKKAIYVMMQFDTKFAFIYTLTKLLTNSTYSWSFLLKKIGIDGVFDDKEYGMIYPGEPIQVVFLFKDVLELVEVIKLNGNSREYDSQFYRTYKKNINGKNLAIIYSNNEKYQEKNQIQFVFDGGLIKVFFDKEKKIYNVNNYTPSFINSSQEVLERYKDFFIKKLIKNGFKEE